MSAEPRREPADPGGALILAAGFSRRFGSDKRSHRLEDGTPMMLATLTLYHQVFERIVLVLREEDEQLISDACRRIPDLIIVRAADAALGMGHSLAAGVEPIVGQWEYCCIALADMPFVRADSLDTLRATWLASAPDTILQPTCRGVPGHPVLFGSCYFQEIRGLHGDEGARSVIDRHRERLRRLDLDDPGITRDLDRPG